MFDDLKEKIEKQNLKIIKQKSKYLEEQLLETESKKKTKNIYGLNQNVQQNQQELSQDSLSDYELEEREQMFNLLIQNQNQHSSNHSNKSSPLYKNQSKEFHIYTQKYFTPQTKIKQLQNSIQLSEQKLKLTQQSHLRQIDTINYQHSLAIQELNIKIQKLQLILKQQSNKTQIIAELNKENQQLKSTLQNYEEKYWKYDQLEQSLSKSQLQNKKLTLENTNLKNTLLSAQSISTLKENQPLKQVQNNNNQSKIKVGQLQKHITKLQNKILNLQRQNQMDRQHFQQISKTYELKIQNLEHELQYQSKIFNQCENKIQKLQQEKDKVEKSLLVTMESFSKHLANQSAHISHFQLKKLSPQKTINGSQNYQQVSIKPSYKIQQVNQQDTINLDLNQSQSHVLPHSTFNKNQKIELESASPVALKTSVNKQSTTQYLSHHDYLKNQDKKNSLKKQIQLKNQRSRIMSHQIPQNKYNINKYIALQSQFNTKQVFNNPEKQTDKSKIMRLQKKLQLANMKIVELLKEKVQKGPKVNFK